MDYLRSTFTMFHLLLKKEAGSCPHITIYYLFYSSVVYFRFIHVASP